MGRLHSVTNGSFREAKLQWRLSGNELEKMAVASRPQAVIRRRNTSMAGSGVEQSPDTTAYG